MRTLTIAWMVLGLAGVVSAAVVPNADFENGLTGWTVFGSVTPTPVPGGGPDGSGCARLESASGPQNGIRSDRFAVEPDVSGQGYDFSVWIQRTGLGNWSSAGAGLEFFDANGVQIGYTFPFNNLQGDSDWTLFSQHYAASELPPGTVSADVFLRLDGGGWYCQFDKVSFGATLNRTAIQTLLDNGGTIRLPKGTHTIDGPVFFHVAGTKLTGPKDAVIRFAPGAAMWGLTVMAANCTIGGITIQGNWDTDPQNNGASGIRVTSTATGCRIDGVTVRNQTGVPIRLDGVGNVRITECTIERFAVNGILLQQGDAGQHCSDVVISGCHILGSDATEQNCIFVRGVDGCPGAHNVTIRSNICRGPCDWGIEVGNTFDGYHTSIIVADNIVDNAKNTGIGLRGVNDGVVHGNRISNCGSPPEAGGGGDGISVFGDNKLCRNVTISGNSITNRPGIGDGIDVQNYEQVVIADNQIGDAQFGIHLNADSGRVDKHCTIQGNVIDNCGAGVRMYSKTGLRNIQVLGNTVRNCAAVTGGCGVVASCDNMTGTGLIIISNNQIENCTGDHAIELWNIQKARVNYNYMMNCTYGVTISGCSETTQTGNVSFSP